PLSALFGQDFIEQVRTANDIAEVIGGYVQLKRAGASFKGLSPFTKEKTPSFYVNPDKQVFYCFSSGQGGDVFRFLMLYEGLRFPEAVERLAERAKIPVPQPDPRAVRSAGTAGLLEIQEKVREHFHSLLMRSPAAQIARDYLKKRGLTAATAKAFRLGYSPDQWDALLKWAEQETIPAKMLERLGLIVPGQRGFYDRFRNRLTIPINDERGRTVGFSARLLGSGKEAKYVNSPETEVFSKGKLLFGLDRAKRALMEVRQAVLCEGQIDCMTAQMNGVENIVAPQGTALTEYQARLLKRYADEVILCYDSDTAGRSATRRNASALLREGLIVRAISLPQGQDPDSFVREKGGDAFKALIASASDIFDWEFEDAARSIDLAQPAGKLKAAKIFAELWTAIADPVLQEGVLSRLAERLAIPAHRLRDQFAASAPVEHAPRRAATAEATDELAETLLAYALSGESHAFFIYSHFEPEWLEESSVKAWLTELFKNMEAEGWESACAIPEGPESEARQRLKARLLTRLVPKQGKDSRGDLQQCLGRLQERFLKTRIETLRKGFGESTQQAEIQREIQELRLKIDLLRKELTSQA
ncbi:MAG: DNA primase, partial [Verrucomicrobiae bacterium]|nr:DNA primase [Verrucomicrobiae bacterium]